MRVTGPTQSVPLPPSRVDSPSTNRLASSASRATPKETERSDSVTLSSTAPPAAEAASSPPHIREVELPEFERRSLSFRLDEELNRVIVQVIDPETHDVVRSIPPEELLEVLKHLRSIRGALLDEEA